MSLVSFAQSVHLAPLFSPPGLAPHRALSDQAARWANHVATAAPRLARAYATRKALGALAFSFEHGLRDLAVPSKLVGVAAYQSTIAALARACGRASGPRLIVADDLVAFLAGPDGTLQPLGRIQPHHADWLGPLLAHGAAVHVHAVTGLARHVRGLPVTLGVNVRVSAIGHALDQSAALVSAAATSVAEPTAPYGLREAA